MNAQIGAATVELVQGNIVTVAADAIVNAANSSLLGGGGVDGAIHRAGGPAILEECRAIRDRRGGCPTGQAVITTAGRLPARYVIHAVGPRWRDGAHGEPELLAGAYRASLQLAGERDVASMSFPSIGTGAYRYPVADAARVALGTVAAYLREHPEGSVRRVLFVLYTPDDLATYERALTEVMADVS